MLFFKIALLPNALLILLLHSSLTSAAVPDSTEALKPYADDAGTVLRLSNEESHPFLLLGIKVMDPSRVGSPLQDLYRTSIERYRSVVDCLKDDARSGGEPNLTMIDWQAMRSEEDAEVCIFRIASSYSAPADMERWFEIQGFDADIIAIPGSNLPAIVAVWLVKEQGVLFSSNIFDRWWKSLLVHSISASVTYDENGLATNSGIGFSAL